MMSLPIRFRRMKAMLLNHITGRSILCLRGETEDEIEIEDNGRMRSHFHKVTTSSIMKPAWQGWPEGANRRSCVRVRHPWDS